jgi:hypothetical protein
VHPLCGKIKAVPVKKTERIPPAAHFRTALRKGFFAVNETAAVTPPESEKPSTVVEKRLPLDANATYHIIDVKFMIVNDFLIIFEIFHD